ncbi:MAG: DUF1963 domain-containing protein [Phormidesmis sp. RL_2_1]|nr:DUF1963 domain-containing protein [Phormidesmis sp. RL_2_1]
MDTRIEELLPQYQLARLAAPLHNIALPAIGLSFEKVSSDQPLMNSRLGGDAYLPKGFVWPANKGRPLNFLLQIDLAELQPHNWQGLLPMSGLLSFFYDLEEKPWGYDPNELDGFCVVHIPATERLEPYQGPEAEDSPSTHSISFHSAWTIPHYGSRAFDWLVGTNRISREEEALYIDLSAQIENLYSPVTYDKHFDKIGGYHRMLGHSMNIQGDMQLEAQLVSNGLYCGDSSGYKDPKRKVLEAGAEDWLLLLQLDSDDNVGLMWGDIGMLYFWIHRDDLAQQRFSKVWMTLQCG